MRRRPGFLSWTIIAHAIERAIERKSVFTGTDE